MNRRTTGIICVLVLLVALASLWVRFRPVRVKFDRTETIGASTGVGQVLAEETANLVQGRGRIVVVSDHVLDPNCDRRDDRWNSFRDEVKKSSTISIAAMEVVEPQPEMGMPGCPASAFLRILNEHAAAAAIVFLTELPEWLTVSDGMPKNVSSKIIAMDTMGNLTQGHYRGYFSSGVLSALIGARGGSLSDSGSEPKTSREWFDKYYQVYTSQNAATLPE